MRMKWGNQSQGSQLFLLHGAEKDTICTAHWGEHERVLVAKDDLRRLLISLCSSTLWLWHQCLMVNWSLSERSSQSARGYSPCGLTYSHVSCFGQWDTSRSDMPLPSRIFKSQCMLCRDLSPCYGGQQCSRSSWILKWRRYGAEPQPPPSGHTAWARNELILF